MFDALGDLCDADDDNDSIADLTDNCATVPNTTQLNVDGDALGDACDPDDDGDGVLDAADICPSTPAVTVVAPSNGCSVAQQCPCAGPRGATGPWKNHGQYASCVARTTDDLLTLRLITAAQRSTIQSTAAQSTCGR